MVLASLSFCSLSTLLPTQWIFYNYIQYKNPVVVKKGHFITNGIQVLEPLFKNLLSPFLFLLE